MQSSILGRISRKLFISAQLKVMHFLNKIEQWIRGIGNNRNLISGVENMREVATTPCRAPLDKMSGMASWSKNDPFKDDTIYRNWMHLFNFSWENAVFPRCKQKRIKTSLYIYKVLTANYCWHKNSKYLIYFVFLQHKDWFLQSI